MLVLTRRKGQSLVLGDNIEISVVDVNGDAVRIAIKAPKEVSIYRREIYDAICEENISAARAAAEMAQKFRKTPFSHHSHSPLPSRMKKNREKLK